MQHFPHRPISVNKKTQRLWWKSFEMNWRQPDFFSCRLVEFLQVKTGLAVTNPLVPERLLSCNIGCLHLEVKDHDNQGCQQCWNKNLELVQTTVIQPFFFNVVSLLIYSTFLIRQQSVIKTRLSKTQRPLLEEVNNCSASHLCSAVDRQ